MTGVLYYQIGVIAPIEIQTDNETISVNELKDIPAIMKKNNLSLIIVVGDIKFFPPLGGVLLEVREDNIILRLEGDGLSNKKYR